MLGFRRMVATNAAARPRYCHQCGVALQAQGFPEFCPSCGARLRPSLRVLKFNAAVATLAVLFSLGVLIIFIGLILGWW